MRESVCVCERERERERERVRESPEKVTEVAEGFVVTGVL